MPEPAPCPYETRLNNLFPPLELVDKHDHDDEFFVLLMIETASIVPTGSES